MQLNISKFIVPLLILIEGLRGITKHISPPCSLCRCQTFIWTHPYVRTRSLSKFPLDTQRKTLRTAHRLTEDYMFKTAMEIVYALNHERYAVTIRTSWIWRVDCYVMRYTLRPNTALQWWSPPTQVRCASSFFWGEGLVHPQRISLSSRILRITLRVEKNLLKTSCSWARSLNILLAMWDQRFDCSMAPAMRNAKLDRTYDRCPWCHCKALAILWELKWMWIM